MSHGRSWRWLGSFALVGSIAVTSAAHVASSDPSPASGTRVAALAPEPGAGHEMSGHFVLPDAAVSGTFDWFEVSPGAPRFAPDRNPRRLMRVEARGLETAIGAWFEDGELHIFRSETPRGTTFSCGCRIGVAGAPAAARVVAEALACMDLSVGPAGLEMRVTREREIQGLGPINRAVRGMPGRSSGGAWTCAAPASTPASQAP